ncbi:MAG: hypothetical protein KA297_11620, partial [Kofleriaceae bacterium]|nr:hypothetical protein [Kofleriaceae bacterium]
MIRSFVIIAVLVAMPWVARADGFAGPRSLGPIPRCGMSSDLRDTVEAWISQLRPEPKDARTPCRRHRARYPLPCRGRHVLTSVLTPVRCDGDTAVVNADWIELYFDPGKVGRRAAVETGVARLQIATLVVTGRQV